MAIVSTIGGFHVSSDIPSICFSSRTDSRCSRPVGLVDHKDVRDLQKPGFGSLNRTPHPGLRTTTVESHVLLLLDLLDTLVPGYL